MFKVVGKTKATCFSVGEQIKWGLYNTTVKNEI